MYEAALQIETPVITDGIEIDILFGVFAKPKILLSFYIQ